MKLKIIIIDEEEYVIKIEDFKKLLEEKIIIKIENDYAPFWV